MSTEELESYPGGKDGLTYSQAFRMLSNRILKSADGAFPRELFLKKVSQALIDFSGCDLIKMVLIDHGRCYRCSAARDTSRPFRFDVVPMSGDSENEITWTSDTTENLERLCKDMIRGYSDTSLPYLTKNGSFWTNQVRDPAIPNLEVSSPGGELGISIDEGSQSLILIPLEADNKRVGILEFENKKEGSWNEFEVEQYGNIVHIIGISLAHRHLQVALRERVKELTCLYAISKLVAHPGATFNSILQQTVKLLPPAWLYPDDACARIVFDNHTYTTTGYRKTNQNMSADIIVDGVKRGYVEIGYVWEMPQLDEGPFLTEERDLIDNIAGELAIIVEQKQAEEEKCRLQEQLLHTDRLATIGQLAAGAAHELNEPLANILGFAQLAIKDPEPGEQIKQDLEKIVNAALHAREVIRKLLLFARETTPSKAILNLNVLVEDSMFFLESRSRKAGIELLLDLDSKLPFITVDYSQLQQVLTNLVVNSVQAMPHGGKLTISTSVGDSYVQLIVKDTGNGMSKEVMAQIFNPFFTTKDIDKGTGLGLSIVHGIVGSHGGTIDVESSVGHGTRFVIKLPLEYSQGINKDLPDA